MKVNLRNLLKNHLFNVVQIWIYCDTKCEPIIYDYEVIFKLDIFQDYLLDDEKNYWSVCSDGIGELYLQISPRFN